MADVAGVFEELAELPRWVAYRVEKRNGKDTKPPYSPRTGTYASSTDPSTWATLEQAWTFAERSGMDGVGIVLGDGLGGVDLDGCRNPDTGEIAPWARRIVDGFSTYTEVSPSGTGLKLYAFGAPSDLPANSIPMDSPPVNGKRPAVEVYTSDRYFCTTGELLAGCPDEIRDCGEVGDAWDRIIRLLGERSTNGSGPDRTTVAPTGATEIPDRLREALEADQKLRVLWKAGKAPGNDRSRNDAALAATLALKGFTDEEVEAAIRAYPVGQVHQEQDTPGYDTERQVSRLLGLAAEAREKKDSGPENCTDLGNARRLVARHGAELRYLPSSKKWYAWDGRRWEKDEDGEVVRRAKDTVRSIYKEAAEASDTKQREALAKWATRSEAEARINAMISLASTEKRVPIRVSDLDAEPWAFNVRNGTLDLRTGELHPHQPEDLISKLAPVRWDPQARAPTFEDEFLPRIMDGDTALIAYLQRAVGYSMFGDAREHKLFIPWGTGANGKSTFLEVVREMMGDYAKQADPSSFLATRSDGVRNDLARLAGARMVSAVEADEGKRLAEALVKMLTGQDTIVARFLYAEHFEFKPVFTPWIATNHKPVIRGTDYAIWRRIKLLPFRVRIPPKEQDKALGRKLLDELPGILRWAVEGAVAWHREGLQEPEVVRSATASYREEMDPLAGFLEDRCVMEDGAEVSAKDLYAAYSKWAEENGEKPLSQTWVGRKLTERGITSEKSGAKNLTHRVGIRLRGEFST